MCTAQISRWEVFTTEGMVRLYLSAPLLTVNMRRLFSQHGSGKGNLRMFAFVQEGDRVRSEGWERCWEWRQTTHHLIMLECATTLCIFSGRIGDRSCYCTNCTRTERAWQEGRWGWQCDGGRKKNIPHFWFCDLSNCSLTPALHETKIWQESEIFMPLLLLLEMRWKIHSSNICNHLKLKPVVGWPLCILALDLNVSFRLNPTVDSPAKYRVCYFCSF